MTAKTLLWQKILLIFLEIFLAVFILEMGLRTIGFIELSLRDYRDLQSIKQKGAYRILCLGESTTRRQYSHLLEQVLNQRNIGVHFSLLETAKGAKSTTTLLEEIESNLAKYHPDMVIAMVGINDGGKDMFFETPTTSKGTLFIRSLRTYQLARFLWPHLLTKAKEMGFYKSEVERRSSVKVKTLLPETGLKENSTGLISVESSLKKADQVTSTERILAEDSLKKTRGLDSKDDNAYVNSGWLCLAQEKFPEAEEAFKKAIEVNPENDNAYVGLGTLLQDQGELSQAEASFKKAVELNPKNDNAYIELGMFYRERREFFKAGDSFKKAHALDPKNNKVHAQLGRFYQEQGKFHEAEDSFKKAIELNPRDALPFAKLGELFQQQGDFLQAEDSFKKAVELDPRNSKFRAQLGRLYQEQGKFPEAEDSFKKAIGVGPGNERAFFELMWFYRVHGKLSQAEAAFKKFMEIHPNNDSLLAAMASLCEEMGKPELAREYVEKATRLRSGHYSAMTIKNYRKLKEILDKKGIKLVSMQYPMRDVEPLKKIFENDKDVIFVDNERVFKEAVKKGSYKEYFIDMFAGDFGHCTQKGNELLAQNIANAILAELHTQS